MSTPLAQKTFKMELEFTVTMNELEGEQSDDSASNRKLSFLKLLQKAVVQDEPALLRQMLGAILTKLQEYADYLAFQSNILSLKKVAAAMNPEDRAFWDESIENFADLTRPLRITSFSTQLGYGTVREKLESEECQPKYKLVWDDLRLGTEYGKLLEKYANPATQPAFGLKSKHFLMIRYLTRQFDGVHCEARCTCETVLEGTGVDESAALNAVWTQFKKHTEFTHMNDKRKLGIKKSFSKN
jgi:hypothetical protein